jgi:hypothetical protein
MTTDPASATRNRTGVAARPAPGQPMQDRRFNVKGWLLWTAGFVSFPIAGIAAQAAAGRINDAVAALVGAGRRRGHRHRPVAGRPPPAR